jgi:hypothetical protein
MAPSIYEYQSPAEWEQAMREWCAENEDKTARVEFIAVVTATSDWDPCWRLLNNQACWRFESPEARAEWLAAHPEVHLIPGGLKEEVVNLAALLPVRNERSLPGGTRAEYRELGLLK